MAGLSVLQAAAAMSIVALGALLQGSVGFGLAIVAAPVLVLIKPSLVPGPLLFSALILTLLMSHREHKSVDYSGLKWALAGRVAGASVAAYILTTVPEREVSILFGLLVLAGAGLSAAGLRLEPSPRSLTGAGAVSGFIGTITAIGGPPMALVYQNSSGAKLRGTLSSYFVAGSIISMALLSRVGRFGLEEMKAGLLLAPGIALGFLLSARLTPALDRGKVRPFVLLSSGLSAVVVIVRALL